MATGRATGELTDRAIVLRLVDLGESDRMVILFTENYGKVASVGKSARASRDRFGLSLDLYRLVLASWRPSRRFSKGQAGRALLGRVEAINEPFAPSLERLATISLWCDFVDRFAPPDVPVPELFETLLKGLELVSDPKLDPGVVRPVVTFELLARQGLAPDFGRCVECGRSLDKTAWKFVRSAKGPVCGHCTPVTKEDRVTPDELKTFDYFRRTPPERWSRLKTRPGILTSLDRFSLDLLEEVAGARLPASRFLGWTVPDESNRQGSRSKEHSRPEYRMKRHSGTR